MGDVEILSKVEMGRAAMMIWAFAVIGRFPEVMKRCVLESWRTFTLRKRWPDSIQVDVREIDCEKGMPIVSESKETTASFACVEALGVNMPPTMGWVPKPSKDGVEEDGSSSPAAEWWIHLETKEWIYHKTDDMYYHLPSGGLWERREAASMDPKADQHTYYRVDAPHLQMLQQFAKALDSSLLPMAWKGWLRYIKKTKDRRAQAVNAPHSSPGGSKQPEPKEASHAAEDEKPEGPPPFGMATDGILQAAESDAAAGPAVVFPAKPPAGTLAEREGSGGILPSKHPASPLDAKDSSDGEPLLGGSQGKPTSKPNERKRGFLVCLCGRSGRRRASQSGSDSCAKTPQADAAGGAANAGGRKSSKEKPDAKGGKMSPKPARKSSKERPGDQVDWTKWMEREKSNAPAPIEALKPNLDTVDRHMKRLDQFMQEVKRNPQRLIDHVERRRAEKTHLAFMLF